MGVRYNDAPTRAQTTVRQNVINTPPRMGGQSVRTVGGSPSVRGVGGSPSMRNGGSRIPSSMTSSSGNSPSSRMRLNGSTPMDIVPGQHGEEYHNIWESESGAVNLDSHRRTGARVKPDSPLDLVPPAPNKIQRQPSVDSIPDETAPPPPVKVGSMPANHGQGQGQWSHDPNETYDTPSKSYTPSQYVNMDTMDSPIPPGGELYQVPPVRHTMVGGGAGDEGVYKVPPMRYPPQDGIRGVRNTVTEHHSMHTQSTVTHSMVQQEDWYQVPPSHPPPLHPKGTSDDFYKVPPKGASDDFYQVPPPPKGAPIRQSHDMFYDVPPSTRPTPGAGAVNQSQSQRNSNSSSGSRDSRKGSDSGLGSEGRDDMYDVPRSQQDFMAPPSYQAPVPPGVHMDFTTRGSRTLDHRTTTTQSVISQGDIYDIPPPRTAKSMDNIMDTVPPPPRPPKAVQKIDLSPEEQGPYLNLPMNSKAHPQYIPPRRYSNQPGQRTTVTMDDIYDFPKGNPDILAMSPPPPQACQTKHSYVNAPSGSVPTHPRAPLLEQQESIYLPMDLSESSSDHPIMPPRGSLDHGIPPRSGLDHGVPPRLSETQDDLYLPMSAQGSRTSSIYTGRIYNYVLIFLL